MKSVKTLFIFKDGNEFGIELDQVDASNVLNRWLRQNREFVEVEGYDVHIDDVKEIRFFDRS